jgi:UDP-N-acetylglucosamine diphosphorylase / glucose-1-phosphate thymidylyltransferase / UDP-N-acetylgalactosamine diphosphorylase / glucosamine-1-phosphate N-acetyltransferase / galactosamine-1-phosphate N-acetyltransferase
MSRPTLVLFDDDVARSWRPFTLTRPAGELLFGTRTLRRRAEEALDLRCRAHLTSDWLEDYDEPWAPPVRPWEQLAPEGAGLVLLLSRFVAEPAPLPDHSALLVAGGEVVGVRLAAGSPLPAAGFLRDPDGHPPDLPVHELPGEPLRHVWELMSRNADRVARDLHGLQGSQLEPHVHRLGDAPVSVAGDATVAPGVVLDATGGPIRVEAGATILPFTYLVGPAWVGPGSSLLGGPIRAVSIGPRCKVHGELEESVVLGYSNKAHDGFLGHAYVGMWVNLGALTTNSDLKNNYGPVRIWTPRGEADTGQSKIGCFLGDHVKTAIGTMINTGTVIEAGANVFGGMPPKHVAPFSWGADDRYQPEPFLATARTVMARREVALSEPQARLLGALVGGAGAV